ncbi:MAG TPA: hypothetical protein VFC68_03900 [Treponemataceae bacterium]|nr:hypothetical protein [Treponemataceae bacterium]
MRNKQFLLLVAIVFTTLFITSCASSQVKGNTPIERAISVTRLIINGKTKDSYIEIYLNEIAQVNSLINLSIEQARRNPGSYLQIADEVDSWIALNNNLKVLVDRYPHGLDGKKLHAHFSYTDYNALRIHAKNYASDVYFEKALALYNNETITPIARKPAISYFEKAAEYSDKHYETIKPLIADLCYSIALEQSTSDDISTLKDAHALFTQADSWLPGYKDTLHHINKLNTKLARAYISRGDMFYSQKNYTAFRSALDNYTIAENYVGGSASKKIEVTKKALTLKVAYYFSGDDYVYPDATHIINLLQKKLDENPRGPAYLEMDFVHELNMQFANYHGYDLVVLPCNNYGKVLEIIGEPYSSEKIVTNTIENTVYSGSVVSKKQTVSVYKLAHYTLYDMRNNGRRPVKTWKWKQNEQIKTFEYHQFFGAPQAKPADFDPGTMYSEGQYALYFPELVYNKASYQLFTANFSRLGEYAQDFAVFLGTISYR